MSHYEKDKVKNLSRPPGPVFKKDESTRKLSLLAAEGRNSSPPSEILSSWWHPTLETGLPPDHLKGPKLKELPVKDRFGLEYVHPGYAASRVKPCDGAGPLHPVDEAEMLRLGKLSYYRQIG